MHFWFPPDEFVKFPPAVSGGTYGLPLLISEGVKRFKEKVLVHLRGLIGPIGEEVLPGKRPLRLGQYAR